jgi:ADP-ribosyltransferase exoenzyme
MKEAFTESPSLEENQAKTQALYHYTNFNSARLNTSLRKNQLHGWNLDRFEKQQVENLNLIASESRTIGEQTFYRGCGAESFQKTDGSFYTVGEIIVNPAFLSTSTKIEVAKNFALGTGGKVETNDEKFIESSHLPKCDGIIYEITVPKDYPIIEVNHFLAQNKVQSMWSDQEEVILGNNGGYRVVEIQNDDQGKITKVTLNAIKDFVRPESRIKSEQIEPETLESKFTTTTKKLTDFRNRIKKLLLMEINLPRTKK